MGLNQGSTKCTDSLVPNHIPKLNLICSKTEGDDHFL